MTPPQCVEGAKAIAALGYTVIPVEGEWAEDRTWSKRPSGDWPRQATRDAGKISQVWAMNTNAYVGRVLVNMISIDLDNKHGMNGEAAWIEMGFDLDRATRTLSKGWHIDFDATGLPPVHTPKGWKAKGVEVRSGGNQWMFCHTMPVKRSTLPQPPEALLKLILRPPEKHEPSTPGPIGPTRDPALGVHPYAAASIKAELARLTECKRLGWDGEPWNDTTNKVAFKLVKFANAEWWTGYTREQAQEDLFAHAPRDLVYHDKFSMAEWAKIWSSVVEASERDGNPGRDLPDGLDVNADNRNTDPSNDFDVWTADEQLLAELVGEPVAAEGKSSDSSGWLPVNLAGYLDGTYEPPEAKLMHRNDGVALLYPGMTHSIHGESESGKSMLAQAEVVVQLKAGKLVCYLDYEADPGSVLERLRLMGATRDDLSRLTYVQPEADHEHSPASRQAFQALLGQAFALAVLDGVNEALAQAPAKARSTGGLGGNDDITAWHDRLPRQIAKRTGAAVVLIDHVAKGPDSGRFAIGGQAKMATISGAAYVVRPKSPLGRNLVGQVDLYVAKDRHGHVRSHAAGQYSSDRMQLAATAVVDGTDGRIRVELVPPVPQATKDERLQAAMARVSEWLTVNPDSSTRVVRSGAPGNTDANERALGELVQQGYVDRVKKGTGHFHTVIKPFGTGFD